MSLLSKIVQDAQDVQAAEEYVATGSKKIDESGNYIAKINMAKMKESKGGAIGIDLEFETEDEKKVYDTIWITTKDQLTYYIDKEGQKRELKGHAQVCALNYIINGVWGLPSAEVKQIKEYNWERKKEEHVEREVIMSWIGKPIGLCVQVTMEDHYNDQTKSLTRVSAEHFFDPVSHLFASEKKKGVTEPELYAKFAEKSEKTPVEDKREFSKGDNGLTGQTVNKESLGF